MDNHIQSMHRKWNMSRIHSKNTKPELLVRSLLHRHGFRFRIHAKSLPGCPDIVMPNIALQYLLMVVSGICMSVLILEYPKPGLNGGRICLKLMCKGM